MADIEFQVAARRHQPITFTLGGSTLLREAKPRDEERGLDALPAQYGVDEHEYVFNPPKSAVMLMPILERGSDSSDNNLSMTKATFDWLGDGLSEADNERIQKRLRDGRDDLDVDTLSTVVEQLTSKVAARPTT